MCLALHMTTSTTNGVLTAVACNTTDRKHSVISKSGVCEGRTGFKPRLVGQSDAINGSSSTTRSPIMGMSDGSSCPIPSTSSSASPLLSSSLSPFRYLWEENAATGARRILPPKMIFNLNANYCIFVQFDRNSLLNYLALWRAKLAETT